MSNKHANEKAHAEWLTTHTPEAVWRSNKAGSSLRSMRKKEKLNIRVPKTIRDSRQIKRPMSSYAHFFQERMNSGAMHGLAIKDIGKLMSQEWKDVSPLDKQVSVKFHHQIKLTDAEIQGFGFGRFAQVQGGC
jgi:hypothetical protein